ncbi:tubulin-specific chaperone C [Kipferlia bialata]|uniref:Tubulin-specific chaperone C n=1 Tax=Kipferlia bialata TaxID=797122 RepID=A0A9K3CQK4_9EUKA|nr:tubulin-specific chaperone C [Kipferlia bialata]|eukprot:g1858.t1
MAEAVDSVAALRQHHSSVVEHINSLYRVYYARGVDPAEKKAQVTAGLTEGVTLLKAFEASLFESSSAPAYERRVGHNLLKELQLLLATAQRELNPRPPFSFSSRKLLAVIKEQRPELKEKDTLDAERVDETCLMRGGKGERRVAGGDGEGEGGDYSIMDMDRCTVIVKSMANSVFINDCTKSVFILGPSTGSIHISRCTDCLFVLFCHQLRIHETHSTAFAVCTGSNPIIENSTGLTFHPCTVSEAEGVLGGMLTETEGGAPAWAELVEAKGLRLSEDKAMGVLDFTCFRDHSGAWEAVRDGMPLEERVRQWGPQRYGPVGGLGELEE